MKKVFIVSIIFFALNSYAQTSNKSYDHFEFNTVKANELNSILDVETQTNIYYSKKTIQCIINSSADKLGTIIYTYDLVENVNNNYEKKIIFYCIDDKKQKVKIILNFNLLGEVESIDTEFKSMNGNIIHNTYYNS